MSRVSQKISNTLDFNLDQLSKSWVLPSQAVIYGEKVIIGYKNLALSEYNMMILYSKSISSYDKNTVYLQYGLIYLYTDYNENPYRKESIGYGSDTKSLKVVLQANRTNPFGKAITCMIKNRILETCSKLMSKGRYSIFSDWKQIEPLRKI